MKTYLIARLQLKFGTTHAYGEKFKHALPALEERGLRLTHAWVPLIGDLTEICHVWEMRDANAVYEVLAEAGDDDRLLSVLPDLNSCIVTERLTVMTDAFWGPGATAP
jgi:hypothetical protein